MIAKFLYSCLVLGLIFCNALGTGKPISGRVPEGNQIIDFVQYINKGSPYFDLLKAPVIAEIDSTDHSITLYAPMIAPPESLYIRFVPSNLFTATLSAEVTWNEATGSYLYEYAIKSDHKSITPIGYFQIEWWNDYTELFIPEGWTAGHVYSRRVNYWSNILHKKIFPGDSLSGIGYESYGPPRLTAFEIWGEMNTIAQQGDDEYFGSIYSGISTKYRGVKGFSIVAWVAPESIEPVDWFAHVCFNVPILLSSGYLDKETDEAIYPTLYDLYEKFQLKENQELEKLEQEVNSALDVLDPYRNQMEPEAQAFIFENLRYILRHQDIVKFKEYP